MSLNHKFNIKETDLNLLSVTSDLTVDSVLSSLRHLVQKRIEFFRNMCIFINIIAKFYDKVTAYLTKEKN